MNRNCQNIECQKPLVRKRYRTGKMETHGVFRKRKFCSISCSVTSRHAQKTEAKVPSNLTCTEQVRRQDALNAWGVL